MELEIVHARSNKALVSLKELDEQTTVGEVKKAIGKQRAVMEILIDKSWD